MGIYRGPGVITKDLVFGYDSGYGVADNDTATRFYSGEPITNYLSSGVSNLNVVQRSDWYGATPTFTLGTSEFGTPIGTYTVGSTSYMYSRDEVLDDDLSTLSGQAVTFSIYLKRSGGSNIGTVGIRVYDNVSGYTTVYAAATSEFQRFTLTKTLGANPTRIFVMIDSTNGGVIDFHSPQLEIGSTASPFVDGTRSDTTSLIDLKRTTSIDVSNVSFDSTGQPDFDGTDDYFTTSGLSTNEPVDLTFETVIRFSGSLDSNDRKVFHWDKTSTTDGVAQIRKGINNGRLMYQHHNGTQWYTLAVDDVVVADTFAHITVVHNGTTATMYKNGVQIGTTSVGYLNYTNAGEILLGYRAGSEYWKGNIPVFKVYETALSASEIKQNYNAYKNRFDI
jgi:hypothetical protein